jgi:DNA-directed RNA polymerase specialized sigma24 family protein
VRDDPPQQEAIDSPGAWLTKVASRICLDLLGSARSRRERYVSEWILEPLPENAAPTEATSLPPRRRRSNPAPPHTPPPHSSRLAVHTYTTRTESATRAQDRVYLPPEKGHRKSGQPF